MAEKKSASPTPTYDIEHKDGRKTRMYNESDMNNPPNNSSAVDDTPVVKETDQPEESKELPPPGRQELTKELMRKEEALRSDSESGERE